MEAHGTKTSISVLTSTETWTCIFWSLMSHDPLHLHATCSSLPLCCLIHKLSSCRRSTFLSNRDCSHYSMEWSALVQDQEWLLWTRTVHVSYHVLYVLWHVSFYFGGHCIVLHWFVCLWHFNACITHSTCMHLLWVCESLTWTLYWIYACRNWVSQVSVSIHCCISIH